MKNVLILLSLIATKVYCIEIAEPPPVELLLLPEEKTFDGQVKSGAHGEKEYCFETHGIFVVYAENLLGEGFSFHKEKPNLNCKERNNFENTKNIMGLTVGLTVQKAEKLIGKKLEEGENEIIWLYQRPINNQIFYDQTVLNIQVKNGVVSEIKIFNTVTN
ncbi:hypothetical protein R50072_36600 [Simiduia litorea]|uniref:hypothetical protein n=1 Tax=Simiduia litorea TaxID=1435348 RepID=UPI0036F19517